MNTEPRNCRPVKYCTRVPFPLLQVARQQPTFCSRYDRFRGVADNSGDETMNETIRFKDLQHGNINSFDLMQKVHGFPGP